MEVRFSTADSFLLLSLSLSALGPLEPGYGCSKEFLGNENTLPMRLSTEEDTFNVKLEIPYSP